MAPGIVAFHSDENYQVEWSYIEEEEKDVEEKKFTEWFGIAREEIDWRPFVDQKKCIGCGFCVTACGRGVYRFDYKNKVPKVAFPSHCMVACTTCMNLCPSEAIRFTEGGESIRGKVQEIVKRFNVLAKARRLLQNSKEELSAG